MGAGGRQVVTIVSSPHVLLRKKQMATLKMDSLAIPQVSINNNARVPHIKARSLATIAKLTNALWASTALNSELFFAD